MKKPGETVRSVLVVEDEQSICDLCRRVLCSRGIEVSIANNGKAAQDMIKKRLFDLLLIDIRMPVIDGMELYHWLKEKHPLMANRVIFTTGSVLGQETSNFLTKSGRPFLLKPFTADGLIAMLGKL